jgi:hypothetical protein
MMKIFVSNNVVLLILVVTTTIDASRLFYLPLPKIHSSHEQIQTPIVKEDTNKKTIGDEFIPSSAIEQEEIEKRGDNFDWEALLDKEAAATKRRITVNELVPPSIERLDEQYLLNELVKNKLREKTNRHPSIGIPELANEHFLEKPWIADSAAKRVERLQSNTALKSNDKKKERNETLLMVIVGACCAVGVVGLIGAAVFWYKIQKRAEAAQDADYPSYGVTGPNSSGSKISPSSTMSDRKLAQSAQMYHYQQQKQQMMAQEKAHLDTKPVHSDDSDDETPAGGDYTVYECPGLAPTGEMEVRNPLFAEPDSSLISPSSSAHPATNNHYPQLSTSPPKEKSLP